MSGRIKNLLHFIFLFIIIGCNETSLEKKILNTSIIPLPNKVIIKEGYFFNYLKVKSDNSDFKKYFEIINTQFKDYYSKDKTLIQNELNPNFTINLSKDTNSKNDHYLLKVSKNKIFLNGNLKGIFYGLQTLSQLIFLNNKSIDNGVRIPCLEINDSNLFSHRGFLLDCCRHFFSVKTIKKYIDLLAFYKMNVLHWHLTEDQGWRIQIDQYPKLNSIGSYRKDSSGKYGGFYTKKEIHEIVQYAQKRNIEVIPEIELPGHSTAAIASYPFLSCQQEPIDVANSWGVFKEIYCAGNDSVFIFLENIFDEIIPLFPSKRIHIGGDEAPKSRWEKCKKCQMRMQQNNLANEHELQSYFIERIRKILSRKNREIIGWDEILESHIDSPISIQSWRGVSGGINAVKQGKKAIMSPTSHCYFDYDINSIDLEKVFSFNPMVGNLDSSEKKLILGGECNLWSERIPNEEKLDQQAFPRMLAMSEVLWSKEKDSYSNFQKRVGDQYYLLDRFKVKYGIEANPVNIVLNHHSNTTHATISSKIKNLKFCYHFGNEIFKEIDYGDSVNIKKSNTIYVQAFKNDKKYGPEVHQKIEIHKALNKNYKYRYPYSEYYSANGKNSLTDGRLGNLNYKDGNWQGFFGSDFEISMDLDSLTYINDVSINFYQYINSWIVIPKSIYLYSSSNGKNWNKIDSLNNFDEISKRGKFIKNAHFKNIQISSKHIKLVAKNFESLPSWHEAAGARCWLFTDEIILK